MFFPHDLCTYFSRQVPLPGMLFPHLATSSFVQMSTSQREVSPDFPQPVLTLVFLYLLSYLILFDDTSPGDILCICLFVSLNEQTMKQANIYVIYLVVFR